jgi:tetratricopeptide (TPR) repeat protein/transcriptional regulator with XRE-family HTH domain
VGPLGATVRAWRKHRGLTVTALAVQAALGSNGRGYISQIEHGRIRHPHDGHLGRIAEALGVTSSDLLLGRRPGSTGPELRLPPDSLAASERSDPGPSARDPHDRLLGAIERLEQIAERLAGLVGSSGPALSGAAPTTGAGLGTPVGLRRSRPFVGRERELRALVEGFELACSGRGQIVLVAGEAGIGKSRLLRELRRRLGGGRHTWLEGRCRANGSGIAYLPFLEITTRACGIAPVDSPAAIARKVRATLHDLDAAPDMWAPYLIELLGVRARTEQMAALAPEAIQSRTFAALRQLTLASSRHSPLVVVVEDVHWIDQASEAYLASLARSLTDTAILLLVTHRPGYEPSWIGHTPVTRLSLQPLAVRDSLRVLDTMPTQALTESVTDVILDRAEGNPLFLEELAWVLGEQNDPRIEPAALDTLPSVLKARIEHLSDRPRAVLQAAAVLGYAFPVRLLGAIWDGPGAFQSALDELKRLELLFENADRDEPAYAFKHPLIHDVAYQSLPAARRRALHGAAGRALEAVHDGRLEEHYDLLAYHFARSPDAAKALEYLERAHRKAVRANAMAEATAYYGQAMKLLDAGSDTPERRERRILLLVHQAPAMNLLVRFPEYYEDLHRFAPVAAGLGNPGLEGAYKACMAWCEFTFGRFDRAIETATEAALLGEAARDSDGAAAAYVNLQWDHLYRGDLVRAQAMEGKLSEHLTRDFNVRWHFYGLMAASMTSTWLGRWEAALDAGRKALRVGEELLNESMVAMAALTLALACLHQMDLEQATTWAELAVQRAATRSDQMGARATLACAWIRGGQPERGTPLLAEALAATRAARFIGPEHLAMFLVDGYVLTGDYDRAAQALEEHLRIAEVNGMRFCLGAAYRRLGELAMVAEPMTATGATAAAHFEQSIAILAEIHAENELALAYAGYGRLQQQLGNDQRARERLTKALETFERLGTLVEPDEARRALARLAAERQAPTSGAS